MSDVHIDTAPSGSRIAELVGLATQTTSRLEILWDEVGYSPDEKRRQMEGLINGFRTLCENKEKQEQGVKRQFIASIADAKVRIKAAREVLGMDQTEEYSTGDMSLTDQLAFFEMEADTTKKVCTAQREKFAKLSEEVVHMSLVLGDDSDRDLEEWRDLDSSLTEARLQAFKDKKVALNKAMEERMQTVAAAVRSVQELMEELKILPTTPLDNRILGSLAVPSPSGVPILQTTERTASSVGIDRTALDEIVARQEELVEQRDIRRTKLEKMGEEILDLWQQLEIGKDEQDIFALSVDGMGVQTLEAGEKELKRLRKLKQEKMGDFILAARVRIRELWDDMGCSEEERSGFGPMQVTEDGFTDDLLLQHNQEAENLSAKLGTMKHILEKIEEREELVRQRMNNETSQKDPSRLMLRGGTFQERRQQQKMLQEELEAEKKIKNRLPSLTSSLAKTIPHWEHVHNSDFMYKGERYLDALQRSEEEYAALKDQIKATKEARKKEERRRLVMASPAPQLSNSVTLGRETPRSVRKNAPGSNRKQNIVSATAKTPRTPMHRGAQSVSSGSSSNSSMMTPERKIVERAIPQAQLMSADITSVTSTIKDVSNKMECNSQGLGKGQKQRLSTGGKEDTENSSMGSILDTYEGCDTSDI